MSFNLKGGLAGLGGWGTAEQNEQGAKARQALAGLGQMGGPEGMSAPPPPSFAPSGGVANMNAPGGGVVSQQMGQLVNGQLAGAMRPGAPGLDLNTAWRNGLLFGRRV